MILCNNVWSLSLCANDSCRPAVRYLLPVLRAKAFPSRPLQPTSYESAPFSTPCWCCCHCYRDLNLTVVLCLVLSSLFIFLSYYLSLLQQVKRLTNPGTFLCLLWLQLFGDCFKFLSGLLPMTYNLLKTMFLPLVFVIDSKKCEFVLRGSSCWLLSHESMPNFVFLFPTAFSVLWKIMYNGKRNYDPFSYHFLLCWTLMSVLHCWAKAPSSWLAVYPVSLDSDEFRGIQLETFVAHIFL